MLSRLQVKNYVLIDSLEIDFPEGLIIITGQTGAGKSILLGALSLITGSKADASMISEGADNCVVEAEFIGVDPSLKAVLDENEVEWEDGCLIIRRVINRSGRSRSFINDCPVTVNVLQEISSQLIDVHSQHQTLLLSDKAFQLNILDYYAGNMELRGESARLFHELASKKSELSTLEERLRRLSVEKDYNEAQFKQLEAANLREGELADLEEEQKQLANAEEIKLGLSAVENLFSPDEGSSLDSLLKESEKLLNKIGKFIPSVSELAERLDSCRLDLSDILSEVESINSRINLSQSRLEEVEVRMSLIYGLLQKHSCHSEAELISLRDNLSETLFDSTKLEEARSELSVSITELEKKLQVLSDRLHESRAAAAESFAAAICESIHGLELPHALFELQLREAPVSASGRDSVVFMFSASGRNPIDVARCASGGEMSRIMLALKAMMAKYMKMPTMIFDEIDTGVSGSVADKMGSMICRMGRDMQLFAITHLPQVAAKGSAHYLVSKEIAEGRAISRIECLSDKERVSEIARMLSGSEISEAAIANAKELLGYEDSNLNRQNQNL